MWPLENVLFWIFIEVLLIENLSCEAEDGSVCYGTDYGLSFSTNNLSERLLDLSARFSNCSRVEGNLELVFLTEDVKLNFLSSIEEVTGYVLIFATYAKVIPLINLKIIRGRTLFRAIHPETKQKMNFSLYVAMNYRDPLSETGLHEIAFTSLSEISSGNVFFQGNRLLCHVEDVNWTDILSDLGSQVINNQQNTENKRFCEKCSENCRELQSSNNKSYCWASNDVDICQKLNKVVCAKNCEGRCFGRSSFHCCHPECAAGCTGRGDTDCLFCRNYKDGDRCVSMCPPLTEFDQSLKIFKNNPKGRFTHHTTCVEKCPGHMLIDNGACVRYCSEGFRANSENECKPYHGSPVHKECGVEGSDWIHAGNINNFINCSFVHGAIQILDVSFQGDPGRNIPPMSVDDLYKMESIEEISDFLEINTRHHMLKNLTFLKSLKFIYGRQLKTSWSFKIHRTKLHFLGMENLESIKNGGVLIFKNEDLCYVWSFNWSTVLTSNLKAKVEIRKNKKELDCESDKQVCSDECSSDGCTGGLNTHCRACLHFQFENYCLSSCKNQTFTSSLYLINGTNKCSLCNAQCKGDCSGPTDKDCIDGCVNYMKDDRCVASCEEGTYPHEEKSCLNCSTLCFEGCSGNGTWLGEGGCNKCRLSITDENRGSHMGTFLEKFNLSLSCIDSQQPCPSGFYLDEYHKEVVQQFSSFGICKKCHEECVSCTGPGNSVKSCSTCRNFIEGESCMAECSKDFYEINGACEKCHPLCSSCLGPTSSNCTSCTHFVLVEDVSLFSSNDSSLKLNCTKVCPSEASYIQPVASHLLCVPQEFANRSF